MKPKPPILQNVMNLSIIRFSLLGAWVLSATGAFADTPAAGVTSSGILPDFKQAVRVEVDDRNPYKDRVEEVKNVVDAESEAARIIRILENLSVRGISRNPSGEVRRVLFGDIALALGADLPQLLEGQTDEIFVSRVSDREVELTWRAEAGKKIEDGRRHIIEIDLDPKVEVVLPGQIEESPEDRERAYLVRLPWEETGSEESTLAARNR